MDWVSNGRSLFSQRGELAASGRITPTLPPLAAPPLEELLEPVLEPPLEPPQAESRSGRTTSPATAIFRIRMSGCPSDGEQRHRAGAARNVVDHNVLIPADPGKSQVRNGDETSGSSRGCLRKHTQTPAQLRRSDLRTYCMMPPCR